MLYKKAGLLDSVVSVYDQTKTTISGRVASKVLSGTSVLGPPLTKYIDVYTDTATAVSANGIMRCTANNRLFVCGAYSGGILPIALYSFNLTTGAFSYTGRINVTLPNVAATTHTIRSIRVVDTGVTGWKIFITTVGSVAINGGLFLVNSIDLADFVPVGIPTIGLAVTSNAKAVYFLQDPSNAGAGQLNIASAGSIIDLTNTKMYVHNGVSATHQYYVYDYSAAPTYTTQAMTITIASPGVVTSTAHGYNLNDPIIFGTLGALPTGITAGTTYFVNNPTANTFEVKATVAGASINTTGTQSGIHVVGRAFGTSTNNFSFKTGNLPALTGTLLLIDSEDYATPAHTANSGFNCAFFATSSNLYFGKLSELTTGTTSWASLVTSNILGSTNQITAPLTVLANYSNELDNAVYTTNTSIFINKQVVNNSIISKAGSIDNTYYEGFSFDTANLGFVTVGGMTTRAGWLFVSGTTAGQRVIVAEDLRSDSYYDYSSIITPVFTYTNTVLKSFASYEALSSSTGNIKLQYRLSGFGTATGGWVTLTSFSELSIPVSSQVQFKILFNMQSEDSASPAQINELILGLDSINQMSDNWVGSVDNTSRDGETPSKSAFRLEYAYATTVPKLYFKAYDDSGSLVASANTVDNPSFFEYSTNNGTSWNPLGTIPNTALTTEVRYNWTTPPGVRVIISLRETN